MFQSKVREVIIQTIHDDVHEVHALLQLRNSILPLPLHSIQQRGNTRGAHNRTVGVFIPGLLPKVRRSLVSGQEVDSDSIVVSNVGGGVIEMLFDLIRTVGLEGRREIEGNCVSVEDGSVGGGRHSKGRLIEREELLSIGGSGKEAMERKDQ
jgi:hypothetical protein